MVQQQKASILPEKHGKLQVSDRAVPIPQGKQALVKITAAAVNPADWKILDYGLFINEFPAVLGSDGAGIIEAVGPEVTSFKNGDRVFFQGQYRPDEATFQQYALVDTEIISKIPDNINDDQASTIPLGSFTAVTLLFQQSGVALPENGPTASGKSVFILGGSSSVGQYAIQLARIAGFSSIVTTSSAQHAEFLKSLGATHVLDRNADAETIRAAFPAPVAIALDAISLPATQLLAFDVLTHSSPAPDAHLALVLPLDEAVKAKNTDGKVSVHAVYGSPHTFRDLSVPFWRNIGQWIKEGKIVPNRVQVIGNGLAGVPEALDLSRKGVSGVKIVVHPQE